MVPLFAAECAANNRAFAAPDAGRLSGAVVVGAEFLVVALGSGEHAVDMRRSCGRWGGFGDDGIAGFHVVAAVGVVHPPEGAGGGGAGVQGGAGEGGDFAEGSAGAVEDAVELVDGAEAACSVFEVVFFGGQLVSANLDRGFLARFRAGSAATVRAATWMGVQ